MVVITVSGPPGSGKSTVAKKIAAQLGLRYVSAGQLFREMAEARGISVVDLNRQAEQDYSIDKEVDNRSLVEAKKGNAVIEGHLTGWVIRDADLKIYLNAPLEVRAKRIAQRESIPLDEAVRETMERETSEKERFRKIYGFNLDRLNDFDLVIDTSNYELEDLLEVVMCAISKSKQIKGVAVRR